MKVLQICSKPPFPPQDGGTLAMNILTKGLLDAGHQVKVLTVNTAKHYVDLQSVDAHYRNQTGYEAIFVDTSIKPIKAFLNLFSSRSYNVERFYSKDFATALIRILKNEDFDIVQLETLWVSVYVDVIRTHSKAKIVLRSQNVEFRIWERLAANTVNPVKKWYLSLLATRLKRYELSLLNKYDGLAGITQSDLDTFTALGCNMPKINLPFGIDLKEYTVDHSQMKPASFFHIGAMDWMPNEEGIKWLVTDVWPLVKKNRPDLKLYLAGRRMPEWLFDLNSESVNVIGEVADAKKFIREHAVSLVPLISGGGMRVKIIEGMAMGKTIISTSVGAEGISCTKGKDILIADTKEDFAEAILKTAADPGLSTELGNNARKLAEEKYDNAVICRQLSEFFQSLL